MNKNIKHIEIIYSVFKLNSPHLLENKNCFIYPESSEDLEEKIVNFIGKNPDIKFKEFLYVCIVGQDNIVIDRFLPDGFDEIVCSVDEKVKFSGLNYCQDKKYRGQQAGASIVFGEGKFSFSEPSIRLGLPEFEGEFDNKIKEDK